MDHNNVAAVETLSDDARDILDVFEKMGRASLHDAEAIAA
jgi:hypothetical protein